MTAHRARPALFLDRDGTLIHDSGYLSDPTGVLLLPGVADTLREAEAAGFLRFIITNQSGIGRGKFSEQQFHEVQQEVVRQLSQVGASVDATYYCPHTPDDGCPCRKPGTALHRQAIAEFGVDMERSWFIGDHIRDIQPAAELGGRGVLVRTGQGDRHAGAASVAGHIVAEDLPAGWVALSRYIRAL